MSDELRILILEDIPADAGLEEHALRKAGLAFRAQLELTESTVLENVEDTIAKMREIKKILKNSVSHREHRDHRVKTNG